MSPFCLDTTEVTVEAYAACVRSGACIGTGADTMFRDGESFPDKACNWGKSDRGDHPMNCVSFRMADTFCESLQKRLPTTPEWEFAARGGAEQRKFPWGDETPGDQLCWSGKDPKVRRKSTCATGSMPRDVGRYGHLDLAGNVREWTASRIREAPGVARDVPTAAEVGRAWSDTWVGRELIGGVYSGDDPSARTSDRGFRCAK